MTDSELHMPALFLAHGNPMHALDNNRYTRDWLAMAGGINKPSAIVLISAHWYTPGTWLCNSKLPKTIHDFSGFPQALFDVEYPAPGAPELAADIASHLPGARLTDEWGLDHGSWSLLLHLFPAADIPVLQLSIDYQRDAAAHFELGKKLAYLRQKNVLVIGSGNIVHNIARWHKPAPSDEWAFSFDRQISEALARGDTQTMINYQSLPFHEEAVPTPEHYLPALYIAAMADSEDAIVQSAFEAGDMESACMRSFAVRPIHD